MELEIRDNRQKEWFWLDNEYLNGYARLLGTTCTAVYISLCRHSDNKSQQCFPKITTIAEENGIKSNNTVISAIKKLEQWNIISVHRSKSDDTKKQNPNIYTLLSKSMWKEKPSAIVTHGKPSAIKSESRVQSVHCNNPHLTKLDTFAIKNTNTTAISNKKFRTREEAKEYLYLKRNEWVDTLPFLEIVKLKST